MLTWLLPSLLGASAVAAAPLVIHLLLKPRPRRQRFAGLRLLRATHFHGIRRQRISQWMLLMLRMIVLLAVVLGAARPVWRAATSGEGGGAVAAVFCIDSSASMHYQTPRGSRLDTATAWAESLLADETRFPPGSQFLVLDNQPADWSGRPPSPAAWLRDRDAAHAALQRRARLTHGRGVLPMCAEALRRLPETGDLPKEIYVLTDLAAHAWTAESSQPAAPSSSQPAERVSVFVLDAGQPENRNAGVRVRLPDSVSASGGIWRLPPGRPASVTAFVTAGDEPFDAQVELWLDGATVARSDPVELAAGQNAEARLVVPPQKPGLHFGELRLDRADRLADDNVAFFVVDVGSRARVCVLPPDDSKRDHVEVRRVAALLDPASLSPDRRPFDLAEMSTAAIDTEALDASQLIVWVEPAAVTAARLARLRGLCERGATLLVIPGPHMALDQWPRGAGLGATPAEFVAAAAPLSLADGISKTDHAVHRYCRFQSDSNAAVTRRLSNGEPAEIEARVGKGRVVWWAYSLRTDWSDLGVRAAGTLVRLHQMAQAADMSASRSANVPCDGAANVDAPASAGPLMLTKLTPSAAAPVPLRREAGASTVHASTGAAGLYRVTAEANGAASVVAGWAVNLQSAESDARRLSDAEVKTLLSPSPVLIASDPARLESARRAASAARPLDGYLLCTVAAMFLGEAWLARRLYRPATV